MLFAIFGLLEDFLGTREEFFSELGEGDGVGGAEEEFAVEVFFEGFDVDGDVEFFRGGKIGTQGDRWYYGESQDDDHEIAVKGDIPAISATDQTFSNEVATVARTVTPPPSPTLRLYDEVRGCWWLGKMVNGVMQWEGE